MNIQEYKDEICRLWLQGLSVREISLLVPFSQAEIREYAKSLKGEGLIGGSKVGRKSKDTKKLVQEAFLQGERNLDNLAKRFNLTKQSTRVYLNGLNRSQMPTDKALAIAKELAQSEYNCHLFTNIAKKYGVTRQYVRYILLNFERFAKEI